ncbi:MAG: tryptophan synthase subunit alpha [Clostridia bacterium]|nr:tryptophan synthase subunit alpha [Clostridia bacterium]
MIDIKTAFEKQNQKAVVAFITAGDPTLQDTERYIELLQESGVDAIEIGIPFSDPIAESHFIQEADLRALQNGVCPDDIFNLLEKIDKKVPFIFMTYANPVFFYGYERFFARCQQAGVAGIIIPDIPFEENAEVKEIAKKYGVAVLDMVAPVSEKRIQTVCQQAEGFVYLLSDMGTFNIGLESAVKNAKQVTATPICKEFDSTVEDAVKIAQYTDGVIIGSAIVKIIAQHGANADAELKKYVTSVVTAVHSVK